MGTYGIGVLNLKGKTLQKLNITQNNLTRYALGIPYKSHIKKLMKAMGIIDVETTYLMEKCTMIKLLHRIQLSKDTLIKNIEDKNENWWLHKEIKLICERLRIEPEEVCYYPDRTRDKLEDDYYNQCEVEMEIIEEIEELIINYTYENKRKLMELIRLNY